MKVKRIIFTLDNETYLDLLDYAHSESKQTMRRISVAQIVRRIISSGLRERSC